MAAWAPGSGRKDLHGQGRLPGRLPGRYTGRVAGVNTAKRMSRTYVYKLTSDRGGAPSAPPPRPGESPLLTLSICKPAIRRTAQIGDRIVGLTSHALARSDGYPLHAVIYVAVVEEAMNARDYYSAEGVFQHRPDCIYRFHQQLGTIEHSGRTPLHADPAYRSRDLGQYPYYRNGRTLLTRNFRYFGSEAVVIPGRLWQSVGDQREPGPGASCVSRRRPRTPGAAGSASGALEVADPPQPRACDRGDGRPHATVWRLGAGRQARAVAARR